MASYPRAIARTTLREEDTLTGHEGGRIADRYTPREQLGSGGMGVVVAAWDERDQREVALKLLHPTREDDEIGVQRFFREARTTEKLNSHFIIKILDVGVDGDRPFIAMERLSGEDLAERLKRTGPLPAQVAVDFTIQACDALAHAHAAGIVHRDIKPSNLFQQIDPDGSTYIKVLDFGISKSMSREEWETTLTVSGEGGMLGSPAYMSPEQIRNAKNVDHRSDFWSLGIVLYKLLTGRQPFDGESVGEIFVRILERTYPSFTQLNMQIPSALESVIGKALQTDRSRRFPNAGEFALALAPFASPQGKLLAAQVAAYCAQFPAAFAMNADEASLPSLPSMPGADTDEMPLGPSPWSTGSMQNGVASEASASSIVASPVAIVRTQKRIAIGLGISATVITMTVAFVLASRTPQPEEAAVVPSPIASPHDPQPVPPQAPAPPSNEVAVPGPGPLRAERIHLRSPPPRAAIFTEVPIDDSPSASVRAGCQTLTNEVSMWKR
jgi:eukaryotic-like serine/threonine-protein kinase